MRHTGNKVLNADSLMKILNLVKPDLILDEIAVDLSFRYWVGKVLGFAHPSVEAQATMRYRKKHKTKTGGYDLEFDRKNM